MQRVITIGIVLMLLAGCQSVPKVVTYDPNGAIYKFIPAAGDDWIKMFGDTDDTRMKHSVSELRVIVAQQGLRILRIEKPWAFDDKGMYDPNAVEVKE